MSTLTRLCGPNQLISSPDPMAESPEVSDHPPEPSPGATGDARPLMLGNLRALGCRARGAGACALVVLALAGCGSPSVGVSHAVSAAAHASEAVTRLSDRLLRSWCPQAVANSGRNLTPGQARGCLQRAWSDWLRELRYDGYDPTQSGRSP